MLRPYSQIEACGDLINMCCCEQSVTFKVAALPAGAQNAPRHDQRALWRTHANGRGTPLVTAVVMLDAASFACEGAI